MLVANRRTQELEKEEWTDKVFTGDNARTTAAMAQEAGKRDEIANPKKASRIVRVSKSVQSAGLQRSAVARAAPSLADTVDEKHLKDIRRVLRRKYASRSNLHRIFGQWDKGDKGGIDAQDLFNGLNKIGIAVTLDEAAALHAAATQTDTDPNLSLQEFSDLLFSTDETLNVNLKGMALTDREQEALLRQSMQNSMANRTIDLKTLDQPSLDKLRLRNQWRAVL